MKFRFRPPISLIPLISLILLLSVSFNIYQFVNRRSSSSAIPVIGVIDGDTLVLEGKVRLRLRHLDAPELNFCGGPEAKQQLENLVTGKSVDITEKILDQRGREFTSEEFAEWLGRQALRGRQELAFVVARPEGFSAAFRDQADLLLSLSRMTLTSDWTRTLLLEQIYRGFTILRGYPYPR